MPLLTKTPDSEIFRLFLVYLKFKGVLWLYLKDQP